MKTLKEKFEACFEAPARLAGQVLFDQQVVTLTETADTFCRAEVAGQNFVETTVRIEKRQLIGDCECGVSFCGHLWAVLLAADAFGDLQKAGGRGVSPQMRCETVVNDAEKSEPQEMTEAKLAADFSDEVVYETLPGEDEVVIDEEVPEEFPLFADLIAEAWAKLKQAREATYTIDSGMPAYFYVWRADGGHLERVWLQVYYRQDVGGKARLQPLQFSVGDPVPSALDGAILTILSDYAVPGQPLASQKWRRLNNCFEVPAAVVQTVWLTLAEAGKLLIQSGEAGPQLLNLGAESFRFEPIFEPNGPNWLVSGAVKSDHHGFGLQGIRAISASVVAIGAHLFALDVCEAGALLEELLKAPRKVTGDELRPFIDQLLQFTLLPDGCFPKMEQSETVQGALPVGFMFVRTAKYKHRKQEQLHAEISYDYQGRRVPAHSPDRRVYNEETACWYPRDFEMERELSDGLETMGLRYADNPRKEEVGWKLLPSRLDEVVRSLVTAGWLVTAQGKTYCRPVEQRIQVKSSMDWFEVSIEVDFGDQTLPLPELLKNLERSAGLVRLDDGTYGLLPQEWLQNYTALTEIGEIDESIQGLRVKESLSLVLNSLLLEREAARSDALAAACRQLALAMDAQPEDAPSDFQGKLRDYQRIGLGWMHYLQRSGLGGILADDMGLGKTVQVLALLSHWQHKGGRTALVVAPKSLLFNWQAEAAKFAPNLKVLLHTGGSRTRRVKAFENYDVVLTTYGTMKRDVVLWGDFSFGYVILDEAQAIKNPDSDAAKAACAVKAAHRLAMTGTPIENNIGDLFSQLEFVNPGMGRRQSRAIGSGGFSEAQTQALREALAPMILRRTKKEVLTELPDKVEQIITCPMPEWQKEAYDQLRDFYKQQMQASKENKLEHSHFEALGALLRLRQTACHPGLVDIKFGRGWSGKLEVLLPMVQELRAEGHKILMFSQFTQWLKLVGDHLTEAGETFCYLDGATKDRAAEVDKFQNDPEVGSFLISLKAGGTGLNLTAASYVFLLDPWWNPAAEAQAVDRAYRMGQKQKVTAYRLVSEGTVEEKVVQLQQQKRSLADSLIQQTGDLKRFSSDQLDFLFS